MTTSMLFYATALGLSLWLTRQAARGQTPIRRPSWTPLRGLLWQIRNRHLGVHGVLEGSATLHVYGERTPYQTMDELLQWLIGQGEPVDVSAGQRLARAIYHAQAAHDLPDRSVRSALSAVVGVLQDKNILGGTVERVDLVAQGEAVDLKRMRPLNPGAIVAQPLGLAIISDGVVVVKAPVLCQ